MAITYFGVGSNPPTDNQAGGNGNSASVTVVPPSAMVAGDLAVFISLLNNNSVTSDWAAMTAGDGQSWNDLAIHHGTPQNLRIHWCQFNGTWNANPTNAYPGSVLNFGLSGLLLAFRPTAPGTLPWSVDITGGESTATFTAPTTPFSVTTAGQTPSSASTVSLAIWTATGDPTWSLQTSGWQNPSSITQWRNLYGSGGPTISAAYKIQDDAAPKQSWRFDQGTWTWDTGVQTWDGLIPNGSDFTGNVTNQQNATGFAGWQTIITFAERAFTVCKPVSQGPGIQPQTRFMFQTPPRAQVVPPNIVIVGALSGKAAVANTAFGALGVLGGLTGQAIVSSPAYAGLSSTFQINGIIVATSTAYSPVGISALISGFAAISTSVLGSVGGIGGLTGVAAEASTLWGSLGQAGNLSGIAIAGTAALTRRLSWTFDQGTWTWDTSVQKIGRAHV